MDPYKQGYIDGMTAFAWWKDGVQEVGTTGTLLKDAIARVETLHNYSPLESDGGVIKLPPAPVIDVDKIPSEHMTYLGDGAYAIFDGEGIWLHANDHKNPTDRVYLEPSVLNSLLRFVKHVFKTGEKT